MKLTRLKYTFEMMKLDDSIIAVPVGEGAQKFRGVVKLNDSAAEIFNLLKHETTESDIIAELKRRYGDDEEVKGFVHDEIEYLKSEGVLE